MSFKLIIQPEADDAWLKLKKSDYKRYRKVGLCLNKLANDPKHPGLNSKRFKSLDGRHEQPIWQSYVENNVPAAYRVFWHYGPGERTITIVAITQHP